MNLLDRVAEFLPVSLFTFQKRPKKLVLAGSIVLILCMAPILLALFGVIPHYTYGEKTVTLSVSADDAVLYQDISLTTEAGTLAEIWEKDSAGSSAEIISYLADISGSSDMEWTIRKGSRVIARSPEKLYLQNGAEYTISLRHK